MVHIGVKTVAVPGTRVPLLPTRTPALWVQIDANGATPGGQTSNGQAIFVGDKTVTAANGHILLPAQSQFYPDAGGGAYIYNLNEIYIDAEQAGDGVRFSYAK